MKYLVCISMIWIGFVGNSVAQRQNVREKLENMKIAFFTNALALSPSEAQNFWPLYNAYATELDAHRRENNRKQREVRQAIMGDDSEKLETLLDEFIELQNGEFEIIKKYHEEFKEILPIRKVAQLYKAEKDFRQRMIQELQKRREEEQQRGRSRNNDGK